jgi:uncharacterized membrane protein YfcA
MAAATVSELSARVGQWVAGVAWSLCVCACAAAAAVAGQWHLLMATGDLQWVVVVVVVVVVIIGGAVGSRW